MREFLADGVVYHLPGACDLFWQEF